jgi:hypothetical protein
MEVFSRFFFQWFPSIFFDWSSINFISETKRKTKLMWIKLTTKNSYLTAAHILIYCAMLVMLIFLISKFTVKGTPAKNRIKMESNSEANNNKINIKPSQTN